MFKVSFSGLRERDVVSDLKKSLFCIWFQLVVIILCFATLLVSTGSALKKDEYEISIKHGSFAVHQRHVNADQGTAVGTSPSVPQAPTVAPAPGSARSGDENGQRNEQFFGDGENGNGERISTTLAVPRPTTQSAADVVSSGADRKTSQTAGSSINSIEFGAVSPGLEEVPLQETVFQSGKGSSSSYQSLEQDFRRNPAPERNAIVKSISAQDFYNTPQLRDRGPVLFATEPTTTTSTSTTTAKPPGKRLKSIPKSAVDENEEIYLLLKYENPRKNSEDSEQPSGVERSASKDNTKGNIPRERQGVSETGRKETKNDRARASGTRGRPQAEVTTNDDFLQEGIRAGGSFTTVGYFVNDVQTTTPMTPVSTSTKTPVASTNKLRNSYGDFLSEDFKDFEDSIRPIEENVDENVEDSDDVEEAAGDGSEDADGSPPEDIDANLDIIEMTRILAGRQGGLTIAEFNRLFKDYLKKEITADDLEEFTKLEGVTDNEAPKAAASTDTDPTKSFDIRAENGKKSQKTGTLAGPTAAQKQQLEKLKVLINKPPGKAGGRKEKLVKIGYGGSKSFQGVYKSQKFLEKVKSERTPLPSDGPWSGLGYRQQLPAREIGPMAYVDNPVFGFVPGAARPRVGSSGAESNVATNGGQSYVKFQKIS
ncbi:uncharacterized protein LOC131282896 [Anopheles ziemanni]|uniref:uncharacterized protein LOC131262863 n=1 Tax=Anopheles coustani TaxID=139045 RepID=UPI00265AB2C3|nr:uncharacterized protein LOC131262863 [Anopheles coustani]XP_058168425.1 uncharacterized protein LOC131282896 [Anopheles ziemanni]